MNSKNILLIAIIIFSPFILLGKLFIEPTFDDWSTLSSPNYDPNFLIYIMPYGYIWRPFDAIMGYIVALDYRMFPILNHIIIYIGHVINVLLVFKLCRKLNLSIMASNVAGLFFFISPCMAATVFSCDSLNQVYSHLWGFAAILAYFSFEGKNKYILWTLFIFIAALAKDNGIAFAVIPPILAFAFNFISRKKLISHFAFGISIAIVYFIIRISLPSTFIENTDYSEFDFIRKIKEVAMLLIYTWTASDLISLMHAPSRNLLWFGITFTVSMPMLYILFIKNKSIWKDKTFWGIIFCTFTALSSNLLISLSMMNTYAGLGMAAVIIAYAIDKFITINKSTRQLVNSLTQFFIACILVNIHYWYMSYTTSLQGKEMSKQVISNTVDEPNKVYVITIKDNYPKFSSFCVIPSDAFGNGQAVTHHTGYKWPTVIGDTMINRADSLQATQIARKALGDGYDAAWIVNRKDVKIINKK